ncbi:MarR family winged helix-turn-helix transcriptional regulator [Raoultibacter timonensis]|uniref:MarR family winged helix-turn-helix transcriptional regulator n=1 Tax=Raoultibacter timonensis TaxID=1907662 RepID=UPI0026DBFCAF|nr:hypothetical protein [Raoultibacter timonensis]
MGKPARDKGTGGMQGMAPAVWAVSEVRPREKKMYELLSFKKSIDTILRTKYGHLTGRQFLVLDAVASRGGSATLTEVAHANQCSTQAARAFVNALQEEGYLVVFEPKDGDKRRIDIALTEEGERLVDLCPAEDGGERAAKTDEHPDVLITNASMFFEQWASAASANR